jgi:putative transposase
MRCHLWQGRFASFPMDERYLMLAVRYVELNPVRARLCRAPWRWQWSSASGHCGSDDPSGLLDLSGWQKQMDVSRWRDLLTMADNEQQLARLRLCTSRGRPLGSDKFVAKLETLLGRRLRPLPRGRPAKNWVRP